MPSNVPDVSPPTYTRLCSGSHEGEEQHSAQNVPAGEGPALQGGVQGSLFLFVQSIWGQVTQHKQVITITSSRFSAKPWLLLSHKQRCCS